MKKRIALISRARIEIAGAKMKAEAGGRVSCEKKMLRRFAMHGKELNGIRVCLNTLYVYLSDKHRAATL